MRLFGLLLLFCSVITAHAQTCPQGVRERKEWRQLTVAEQQAFFAAVRKLMERPTAGGPSRWDQIAQIHLYWGGSRDGFPPFFPWHRAWLVQIEKELQAIDRSVMVPYWDFNRDNAGIANSPVVQAFGGNGIGSQFCVSSGPFASWIPNYPTPHCLSRRIHPYSAVSTSNAVNQKIQRATSYDALRRDLDVEVWAVRSDIGGDLSSLYGPNDPLAVLIMANADRWWTRFQARGTLYQSRYNGRNANGTTATLSDKLPPYTLIVRDLLDTTAHCYTYSTY